MIAYNQEWLDARLTQDTAREWQAKGLLSSLQWQAIQERYRANFYSPNVFVRIGLAIFCLILMLAVAGLGIVIWEPDEQEGFGLVCLFWGIIWMCLLEFWAIRSARHYGSGIDDMLLYGGITAIIAGICILLPYESPDLVYYWVAFPFLVAGAVRYADRLLAAAAFLCALGIILLSVKEIPRLALYLLPFAGMIYSAATYQFARQGGQRFAWRYWSGLLAVIETLALVTFYGSGNYWVIQQAGLEFFQLEQVPMPWFFWTFTFGVPVLYILLGLRYKDRLLLDIGLACVGAAVFTFRYYFHVLPLAWAGVLIGAFLFITAYFSIRYLRKHPGAYTFETGAEKSLLQEIEEQLIEQTIASQNAPTPVKNEGFGGGQFGGGGAGQDF